MSTPLLSSSRDRKSKKSQSVAVSSPISYIVDSIPFENLNGEESSVGFAFKKSSIENDRKLMMRAEQAVRVDPEELLPIQPWKTLRTTIMTDILHINISDNNDPEEETSLPEQNTSSRGSLNGGAQVSVGAITIPFGFQILQSIWHSKPTVRQVVFIPSTNMFLSMDNQNVHFWKGTNRISKISIHQKRKNNRNQLHSIDSLVGVNNWKYIEKYQTHIVTNTHLQIKVLHRTLIL
jgi:hypothetical protein